MKKDVAEGNNKLPSWPLLVLIFLPNGKNEEVGELERKGKEKKHSMEEGC